MNLLVFLISLDKDSARRQRLKERFGEYENFTLISAVDGRIMSAKEYFALVMPSLRLHGRLMSPAEAGCTLSHVKAYEAFIASGEQRALFIEDDVIGDDSCVKFAFETARELPLNGVLLCGCQDGLPARFSAFGKRIRDARNLSAERLPTPINGKDRSLFAVLPRSYGAICSTAAYVLTREAAQKLLYTHKGTLSTSDLWDYLLPKNGLKMYFCDIFAHPTDLSDSNTNAERDWRGYAGLNLVGILRSAIYVLTTRFAAIFSGYERIFKRGCDERRAAN